MANVTRDQFDETKRVVRKVFQHGTHLMDADLNEVSQVLVAVMRRQLSALTGHANKTIGDGFKVIGTGASLAVTVKAGYGIFQIASQSGVLLNLAEDTTVSGFTAWTGARTDYVYLDLQEVEISPADDPNVVNPAYGSESCRDIRLQYSFAISEGAAPGTPPAGHVYVSLATVTKASGSNIEAGDVTVLLADLQDPIETDDIADDAVTQAKIADNAIGTLQLINDAVTIDKVADNAVDTAQIVTAAITLAKMAANSVGTAQIVNDAVTGDKIADDAVGVNQLATDAVTQVKIADAAVNKDKIDVTSLAGDGLQESASGDLDVVGVQSAGNAVLKCKTFTGNWNMDSTGSIAIAHGLSAINIRSCTVMIQAGAYFRALEFADESDGVANGNWKIDSNNVILTRKAAGEFDSINYTEADYYITLWYAV